LPHKFGITPFIIDLKNAKRLKNNDIAKNIVSCLKLNRIAQVNVVVCRYNNKTLEVLILKRTKNRGGFWQAVTGGVHIGESLIDTATREVKEELALSVSNIKYTNFFYSFMGNDNYILHEYVYVVLVNMSSSLKIKISKEHDEYKWVDEKTAISHLKFEDNKNAVKKSIKIIKATK
jgi:8-oxo-dGTP pyrophosphatase MutT (NUDIX family)